MGEAKRRKLLDSNYGKSIKPVDFLLTSGCVLALYTKNPNITYHDFVSPNFKPDKFDINSPHTVFEWQSFFFSTNPECAAIDKLDFGDSTSTSIRRNNLHAEAFNFYLYKKIEKNLVIDPESATIKPYLKTHVVKEAMFIKPII